MLSVSPSGPTPIGAITGIRSEWMITSIMCGSTPHGVADKAEIEDGVDIELRIADAPLEPPRAA